MGSAPGLDPRFADLGRGLRVDPGHHAGHYRSAAEGEAGGGHRGRKVRGKNLIFDQYQVLVRFRPQSAGHGDAHAVGPGRVLMGELGPDEFLILGFDSAVDFRPRVGSKYTAAQLLQADQVV